jgi:AcrR family transcriptional regulator
MPIPRYASVEKRAELVTAAKLLLHEQGLHRTTLADVASRADVPLGNIYYYFKTKDSLAEAVLEAHDAALRADFASWESAHDEPMVRLRCLVRAPLSAADRVVEWGFPLGSLLSECAKLGASSNLAKVASRVLARYIEWVVEQFRADGFSLRESRDLAMDLVGAIEWALLLASTMGSKGVLRRRLRRIERWLSNVSRCSACGAYRQHLIAGRVWR